MSKLMPIAILALFLVACGDDEEATNNTNNTNNNNTVNNTNNNTTNNTNNNNTTNNTNNNNTTNNTTQCSAAGEACVSGEDTATGFHCVEDVCQVACDNVECASGTICIPVDNTPGSPEFCLPSDCQGIDDATSCVDDMGNQVGNCTAVSNNTFLCLPAGTAAVGEECSVVQAMPTDPPACSAGLQCIGVCVEVCDEDSDCSDGQTCAGEADGFVSQGFGICGQGCTPYSGEATNCPAGSGCVPITEEEGACDDGTIFGVEVGTLADYAACDPEATEAAELCGPNTRCIGFQDDVARCLPYCNAAADSPAASNATCPADGDVCLDLSTGTPSTLSGVCLAGCGIADYGMNSCPGDENTCVPFRGESHQCFPGSATGAAIGAACDPSDLTMGCVEGAACEADGAGGGICRSFCHPADMANNNAALVCASGEACNAIGDAAFNFGQCGLECTPTNYADVNCPANLQSCLLAAPGDTTAFCSASGAVALGAACEDSNCGTDGSCTNPIALALHEGTEPADACHQRCDLFADTTGCPANMACVPNLNSASTVVGICLEDNGAQDHLAPCTEPGTACGEAAYCTNFLGQAPNDICFKFCSVSLANCPQGQTCSPFGDLDLGTCQ